MANERSGAAGKDEAGVKQALKEWIVKVNRKVAIGDLKDDTPLIEQRIISSLQVMDLILHLERLRGRPVEIENLKPGVFRTLDDIHRNFFQAGG